MASIDPAYRNLIQFVPPKTERKTEEKSTIKPDKKQHKTETGTDIKNFYESLIHDKSFSKVSRSASVRSRRKGTPSKNARRVSGNGQTPITYESTKFLSNPHTETTCTSVAEEGNYTLASAENQASNTQSSERPGNVVSYSTPEILSRQERQHFKLLQAVQLGNLNKVSELLKQKLNINYKDFFGWTPLMCAAKEGHGDIVKHLLKHGADPRIENSNCQTASSLAIAAGHTMLAEEIVNYRSTTSLNNKAEKEKNIVENFLCQVCQREFSVAEQNSHNTSTLHLFNMGHKPKAPSYLIPPSNRGFQMLLRTGWEMDKGLGRTGEGTKYPVKTVLKHDRTGLGADEACKKKAKVTHFNPNDKSAIDRPNQVPIRKMSARKAARLAHKAKEKKEKQAEQKLRWELNSYFQ